MHEAASDTTEDGTVERVTFYNPQNGFSVVKLRVRGRREPIAVVGPLPAVQPGEGLTLRGRWRTDPQHGAQFAPHQAEIRPPRAAEDIARYLGSGLRHAARPGPATSIATSP
jgi:exodeoxyribonuclease V alpha subunit